MKQDGVKAFFLVVFFLVSGFLPARAADLRDVWEDRDKDKSGEKESHVFYDGKEIQHIEKDRNKDGKPDAFSYYEKGKRAKIEEDRDFDGKIDSWGLCNPEGFVFYKTVDSNNDGKVDKVSNFVDGKRDFVLKEADLNFDGKIDKRMYQMWDAEKMLSISDGSKMNRVPNPGYTTIWMEEDGDFDGVIDKFKSKDKMQKNKTGQPMNSLPTKPEDLKGQSRILPSQDPAKPIAPPRKQKIRSRSEKLVDALNEQRQGV